jgi:hypothetical protein
MAFTGTIITGKVGSRLAEYTYRCKKYAQDEEFCFHLLDLFD